MKCAHCGTILKKLYRDYQVYCSPLCRQKARSARKPSQALPCKTKTCTYCKKTFATTRPRQCFCSRRCNWKKRQTDNREAINKYAKEKMRERRAAGDARLIELATAYRIKPESRIHAAAKSRTWHAENHERANPKRRERKQVERKRQPWKGPLDSARIRASKKNLLFDLTEEWAIARWTGRCELSGIPFRIGQKGAGPRFFAASLDRIRPKEGYTQTNSRFLLWAVNAFKYDGTDQDVFRVAQALMLKRSQDVAGILSLPG
jgi:hypothetical protein